MASLLASAVARAAVAPILAEPTLRAEQVTQLVIGEIVHVHEARDAWRRVTTDTDGYGGWIHAGYLIAMPPAAAEAWRREATSWSEGAVVRLGDGDYPIPLRGRLAPLADDGVRLPDGRTGRVVRGVVRAAVDVVADARSMSAAVWATDRFRGAPYLWGGVTPWGVDCSGLVQTTFAARGIPMPRDAAQQAERGRPVVPADLAPDDLLFFGAETAAPFVAAGQAESPRRVTHVAFAGPEQTLVHATITHGGVVVERRDTPAADTLLRRLVAIRRVDAEPETTIA